MSDPSTKSEPRHRNAGVPWIRFAYYALWFVTLPLLLAVLGVWLLSPSPGSADPGPLRMFAAEQPIPMAIILFTVITMGLWRVRHRLPFALAAGMMGRQDIPAALRPRVESVTHLMDEVQRIMKRSRREITRDVPANAREDLETSVQSLETILQADVFSASEFESAAERLERLVPEVLSPWRKGEVREYTESVGLAILVALLLRAVVVEAFKIPSGSMIPTLRIGDHIFVNKFTYGPVLPILEQRVLPRLPPDRGDVIVFRFPEQPDQDFIKRTIALPGDTLEAIDGRPIINGWLAPHCYVGEYNYEGSSSELFIEFLGEQSYFTLFADPRSSERVCSQDTDCEAGLKCRAGVCGKLQGPFRVAPGEVWVMGDNRNRSHDSRTWFNERGGGVPFANIKGRAMFVWLSLLPTGATVSDQASRWVDRFLVGVMGDPTLTHGESHLAAARDKCLQSRPPLSQTTPPPPRR